MREAVFWRFMLQLFWQTGLEFVPTLQDSQISAGGQNALKKSRSATGKVRNELRSYAHSYFFFEKKICIWKSEGLRLPFPLARQKVHGPMRRIGVVHQHTFRHPSGRCKGPLHDRHAAEAAESGARYGRQSI